MNFRFTAIVCIVIFTLTLSACIRSNPTGTDDETFRVKTGVKPIADAKVAVIETEDFGEIVIELYPNIAPQMVERFKKLVHEGFYDGTTFHRINEDSALIQGGDPLSRDNDPENDGTGDSPYPNVPGEFSDLPFERGSVGAARREASPPDAGQPGQTEATARNSANCQFFITLRRESDYDEDYTLFGRIIAGLGNAEIIMRAPVAPETETPAEKITIKRITLQDRAKYPPATQ
ncbi:MAG: peptidylprolyl isomerase [Acidobacteriota bacterium]|nr:peptidylprolyl isomerase [Acidobacteriota bacterium]